MKKTIVIVAIALLLMIASKANAQYYSVGLGPVGNIFAVESSPNLGPGVGGSLFFDYRWNPQLSTQIGLLVTDEDGKGVDSGDKNIFFIGAPTLDIKYYLLSSVSRWDPYLIAGVGFYLSSEGSVTNGSLAVGVGANVGVGCDFYFNDRWSVGTTATFRSVGLIDSTSGPKAGTALFPVSLTGNVAYHF